jgi:hypothetical protein
MKKLILFLAPIVLLSFFGCTARWVKIDSVPGKTVDDVFDGGYDVIIKPQDIITKGPWVDVRAFGANGDDIIPDNDAVQQALNAGNLSTVYFPKGTYIITRKLTLVNSRIRIIMPFGALLKTDVPCDYFLELTNCQYCNIEIRAETTGNGIKIQQSGSGNSVYNEITGHILGPGFPPVRKGETLLDKSPTKPELGGGSVGVYLKTPENAHLYANYFNRIKRMRIAFFDTGILLEGEANGNTILDPQIEHYWYGIELHSNENTITGGFFHWARGTVLDPDRGKVVDNVREYTEAIHVGDGENQAIYNQVIGTNAEPGFPSKMLYIDTLAKNNTFIINSNTFLGNVITNEENLILNLATARFGKGIVVNGKKIQYGSFPPTIGVKGDIIYNDNPLPGGKIGWVCVGSGAPATWRAFGNIEAP